MSGPVATAVIVAFNQGRYVEEAVRSVLAQEFPASELEILVVDDGSTDDTEARAKGFGDRVRYVRKDNGGEASALNLGIEISRGDIIALLEADDLWHPGKLGRVARAFDTHPDAAMVYHPYEIWDTRKQERRDDPHFVGLSGRIRDHLADLLTYDVSGTSVLSFRRSFLERLLPIPPVFRTCVDVYLASLIVLVGPVVALEEVLATYRKHDDNQSGYDESDAVRRERRWFYVRENVREMQAWVDRSGLDARAPDVAAYLKRWELWEQICRFCLESPGRRQLFRHLREHQRLYGPVWTRGYRTFKAAVAVAALALGYERFESMRARWGGAGFLVGLRKRWLARYAAASDRAPRPDRGRLW
ncbi:MAG TPA: glycosyltransferase [Candidatus Methylomirabilis sp.]|nr:glycosyltransferase [Candidatus Methylomirabilis sp.]